MAQSEIWEQPTGNWLSFYKEIQDTHLSENLTFFLARKITFRGKAVDNMLNLY